MVGIAPKTYFTLNNSVILHIYSIVEIFRYHFCIFPIPIQYLDFVCQLTQSTDPIPVHLKRI